MLTFWLVDKLIKPLLSIDNVFVDTDFIAFSDANMPFQSGGVTRNQNVLNGDDNFDLASAFGLSLIKFWLNL